jgi:hypothetical protein
MMTLRRSTVSIVLAALLGTVCAAAAFDETKYPNLKGQWLRVGSANWRNPGQKPPLTSEYQTIFDANLRDQAAGGHGTEPSYACLSPGMPRIMIDYTHMEIVLSAETTYILIDHINDNRRIFTDGRDWPAEEDPAFHGYSIGRWVDTDNDGHYDTLEVETRNFKGPRAYDTTGLPLHSDNETVVKERIYLDKADPDLLHDDVTTIDHALTEPVDGRARLPAQPEPAAVVGRDELRREQSAHPHRHRELFHQRRRVADAGEEGSGAAGSALFCVPEEMTPRQPRSVTNGPGRRPTLPELIYFGPSPNP